MLDENKVEAATELKNLAEWSFQNRNLTDAFFYYLHCLKLCPSWRNDFKERFLIVLSSLGQQLEKKQTYSEIFTVYKEALAMYDDSEEVYHNLGAHLLRLGHPDVASYYLKEALKRNENYFPAFRSLHSTYCALVERWHYRMLNDSVRNAAYKEAILKKVQQGFDVVLDVGTGTGIFCLYAIEAGAKKIYACDYNPVMQSIASKVFEHNEIAEKISLINKHSNAITIPEDLRERVSLVVTETLDSCILGEHLLQSLKYAWDNLLQPSYLLNYDNSILNGKPKGIVIPFNANLQFVAIESRFLAKNYIFPLPDKNADECASAFANISLENSKSTNFQDLKISVELSASSSEPYDTERLQLLHDCTFLTEPQELFSFDFNDPREIETYLLMNPIEFNITCTREGFFHAISAWFRLQLDEHITISSAPNDVNAKKCCWDQAIFPCLKSYHVVPGSKINIFGSWCEDKVSFKVKEITHPDGQVINCELVPFSVPSHCISMLNDSRLITHLKNTAMKFIEKYHYLDCLRIIDFFSVPVFSLTILCNTHLLNISSNNIEVYFIVGSLEEKELIQRIAECNSLQQCSLFFIEDNVLEETIANFSEKCFDAAVMNLVDVDGDLNENAVARINLLKPFLKKDGIFLPSKIEIRGQLINSEFIERNMRIVNDEILSCGIGSRLNEFQVSQMLEIDVVTLPFEICSAPFECHQFLVKEMNIEFSKQFDVTAFPRKTSNSILFWYNISFFDEQQTYSTLSEYSYVHQAAYLSKFPIICCEGNICIEFVYHHGAFIINPITFVKSNT